jgi:hypothetical protein
LQTGTSTNYQLSVDTNAGDIIFNMNIGSEHGMDDATCLGLVQMLRDFPWPSAMQPVMIWSNKTFNTTDNYTCAVNATPPTFN